MLNDKDNFLAGLMKTLDLAMLFFAFFAAYFVDEIVRDIFAINVKAYAIDLTFQGVIYFTQNYWLMFIGFPLIWAFIFNFNGIYRDYRLRTFRKLLAMLVISSIWATLVAGSFIFLLKIQMASRLFFLVYSATAFVCVAAEKGIFFFILEHVYSSGYYQENLLIVGTNERALEFIRHVKRHAGWGLHIIGIIDDDPNMYGETVEGYRVVGRIEDIPFVVNRLVIDRVIFVVPRLWLDRIEEAILECEKLGVPTSISLDLYQTHVAKVQQTDFDGFPLLEFKPFYAKEWQLFVKRVIDIIVSFTVLLIFSPVMLIVALLIKLTSKGPVLFKQERIGLNGRKFTLFKFRSMVVDAEKLKEKLMQQNEMTGPVFKMKKDPRITSVGYFLRRTSIDELPQFLNVLKGDMSIVGPRPPLESEVEQYEVWQRRRLSLKPGITCIWQISGRNRIEFEDWMKMDLEYIDNWSLFLDLKIMIKTFFVVLTGYGAQ
ncbi:MAG: sugar transferase [candidate division KSB1 bacterium]|nr:sugar transferase [candidate division KSB1 bacterium]